MNITAEGIYIFQLICAVCAGGFIGEFNRTSASPVSLRIFIAHFLAGSFLSFIIAYLVYSYSKGKTFSLALGGFLSYQDERYVNKVAKHFFSYMKEFKLPPDEDTNSEDEK